MTRKKKVIFAILGSVAALVIYMISRIAMTVHEIPEAYAAWATADLIIHHMQTHSNQWPRSWDELLANTNTCKDLKYGHIEDLPNMVKVDWNADPDVLAKATDNRRTRPFAAVTRENGSSFRTVWSGKEPNQMILDYLKK